MSAHLENLLARMDRVRRYGQGYRAKCPAHDGESDGSLSVCMGDDGRILLHCFGGCEPLAVVHSVGLELADLFPQRITHMASPAERRQLRQAAREAEWRAALCMLDFESKVLWTAGKKLRGGWRLNEDDNARLDLAESRIAAAWRKLHVRP